MTGSLLANHLWQSTLVAGIAWLVTLVLRRDRAGARYAIWLAASLKFLVPFAFLVAAGHLFVWRTAPVAPPARLAIAAEIVSQPFPLIAVDAAQVAAPVPAPASAISLATILAPLAAVWLLGVAVVFVIWFVRWRRVSAIVRAGTRAESGPVFDALRRIGGLNAAESLPLVESDALLEPGVFGIVSPVLVWPRKISEHLSVAQIDAIVAHELAHVRRRDNLTAVLHMAVEAAFWFHPMVWWIGSRLIDERERACDEYVVRQGSEPQIYAESILKTCQFCIESPVACVAGVTGSDLRTRIVRIITNDARTALAWWKKCLVATTVTAALVVPIAIGVMYAPPLLAHSPLAAADTTLAIAEPQAVERRVDPIRDDAQRFKPASVRPSTLGEAAVPVAAPAPQAPEQVPRQYRLGPQDVLKITVLDRADLTQRYRVDSEGAITLPYINRIQAAGLTLGELADRIRQLLANGVVNDAQVRVEIESYKSESVMVSGEVHMPGKIAMTRPLTVLEALATAGSPTSSAAGELTIARRPAGSDRDAEIIRVNWKDLNLGKGTDVALQDGDIINVPKVETVKSQSVVVVGEVRMPGKVAMSGTMTVLEALAAAGSPTSSASSELTIVKNGGNEVIRVNWKDLNLGKGTDVALQDGDLVNVPRAQTFAITGQVRNPGALVLEPGMTVQQAIALVGGLTDRAAPNRIRARRVIDGTATDVNVTMEDKVLANDVITVGQRIF